MSPDRASTDAAARARLRPLTTLSDVLGPGVAYVPRRSISTPGWGPTGPGYSDAQTGGQLTVAGPVPFVCSAGAVTRAALDLFTDVGLSLEAEIHAYATPTEYLGILRRLGERGTPLAVQRAHPEHEIEASWCWVPPDLLRRVNDKGKLDDLVPREWQAPRQVVEVARLPRAQELLASNAPVVLKAASPLPSGGGHCVWICRTNDDVERARVALASEPRVVVEEFLRLRRTVCFHAAVTHDGHVFAAGVAEEVVDAEGHWRGNWLDAEADAVPVEVHEVVRGIVERAAALGYRGIVGIDVAFPVDTTPRVLDLNFRSNGSTAPAWLRPSVFARLSARGASVARARSWDQATDFDRLARVARQAAERGSLLPLALYDPAACSTGGRPRLFGLVLGRSRDEVREEERRLEAEGLA